MTSIGSPEAHNSHTIGGERKVSEASPDLLANSLGLKNGEFVVQRTEVSESGEAKIVEDNGGWEVVGLSREQGPNAGEYTRMVHLLPAGRMEAVDPGKAETFPADDEYVTVPLGALLSWQPADTQVEIANRDDLHDLTAPIDTRDDTEHAAGAPEETDTETTDQEAAHGEEAAVDLEDVLDSLDSLDSSWTGRAQGAELRQVIPVLIKAHRISDKQIADLVEAQKKGGANAVHQVARDILHSQTVRTLFDMMHDLEERGQGVRVDELAFAILRRGATDGQVMEALLRHFPHMSRDMRIEIRGAMPPSMRRAHKQMLEHYTGYPVVD